MTLTYKDSSNSVVTEKVSNAEWKGTTLRFTNSSGSTTLEFTSIWDALECRLVNIGDALKASIIQTER